MNTCESFMLLKLGLRELAHIRGTQQIFIWNECELFTDHISVYKIISVTCFLQSTTYCYIKKYTKVGVNCFIGSVILMCNGLYGFKPASVLQMINKGLNILHSICLAGCSGGDCWLLFFTGVHWRGGVGGGAQNYVGILGKNIIDPIVDSGYIEECS